MMVIAKIKCISRDNFFCETSTGDDPKHSPCPIPESGLLSNSHRRRRRRCILKLRQWSHHLSLYWLFAGRSSLVPIVFIMHTVPWWSWLPVSPSLSHDPVARLCCVVSQKRNNRRIPLYLFGIVYTQINAFLAIEQNWRTCTVGLVHSSR